VRDVHQRRFHAFIVTCSAAAVAPRARRSGAVYNRDYAKRE